MGDGIGQKLKHRCLNMPERWGSGNYLCLDWRGSCASSLGNRAQRRCHRHLVAIGGRWWSESPWRRRPPWYHQVQQLLAASVCPCSTWEGTELKKEGGYLLVQSSIPRHHNWLMMKQTNAVHKEKLLLVAVYDKMAWKGDLFDKQCN